jgi:hypothetical protein
MVHCANAAAIAYVELRLGDGSTLFGVGIDKIAWWLRLKQS